MDQILDAPQQENRNLQYAGFWIRVAAYLIDGVVLWIVNVILSFLYLGAYSIFNGDSLLGAISLVVGVLYFTLMESSERQATLGKLAVGIKVGDQYGNRISFANALGRYIAKVILSIVTLTVSLMWVGWDDRKQGLHDKLADTYVFQV